MPTTPIPAFTFTWIGGVSADWSNPLNWSGGPGGTYPGEKGISEADTVVIGTDSAITFDAAASGATIFELQMSADGASLDLGANVLNISGATSTISAGAITLEGGALKASSSSSVYLQPRATISGYGTVSASQLTYSGSSGGGTITAIGGGTAGTSTLDLTGPVKNGIKLVIGDSTTSTPSSTASDLKIDGFATQSTISLTNSNQTLEIGATGTLYFYGALNTTGGTIQLDGGSLVNNSGISLGAASVLDGAGTISTDTKSFNGAGTVIASGGTLAFSNSVDQIGLATSFNIDNSATLTFKGAVGNGSVDPTVTFNVASPFAGYLNLTSVPNAQFDGTVKNFLNADEIFVGGSSSANSLGVTDANGVLDPNGDYVTVKDGSFSTGTLIQTINMGTNAAAEDVGFSSGSNLILVTDAICFMAGTMIRTPDGEVAVETLLRGDLVLTADGQTRPVSWLGRQTISTRFADPLRTWPVRIKAGALAENVPGRDLLLSPDHAVLVDGALIHAGALVNETSIVHETSVPEIFTYYHVELDDHSLVLAENTPAETFVDNVERLAFDNWAEHEALYPEGKSITELPYPRAKGRRQVPVYVRVQLAERAEIIGASTAAVRVA